MLAELRAAGLQLTAQDGMVYVEPKSALTDELRATIREHKPAILRVLEQEAVARMTEMVTEFAEGLRIGCVVLCEHCVAFTSRPDSLPDGWCSRYQCETWSRVPFACAGYQKS
jgi:TubC N-terminal docking domain